MQADAFFDGVRAALILLNSCKQLIPCHASEPAHRQSRDFTEKEPFWLTQASQVP